MRPVRGLVKLGCVAEGGVSALEPPLETPCNAPRVRWNGFSAGDPEPEGGPRSCRMPARRGFYHNFEHFLRAQVLRDDGVNPNTQDLYYQGGHLWSRHRGEGNYFCMGSWDLLKFCARRRRGVQRSASSGAPHTAGTQGRGSEGLSRYCSASAPLRAVKERRSPLVAPGVQPSRGILSCWTVL